MSTIHFQNKYQELVIAVAALGVTIGFIVTNFVMLVGLGIRVYGVKPMPPVAESIDTGLVNQALEIIAGNNK